MLWLTLLLAQESDLEPKAGSEPVQAPEPAPEPAPVPAPEPVPEPAPPAPEYAEMLVTATQTTRSAELALETEIRELGYRQGFSRSGRTQYFSAKVWQPRITVYDAGFVEVRGRRVTPMMPMGESVPVSDAVLPGASGVWQSKRQARGQEDRLRREVEGEVRDWQQAIQAQTLIERQLATRNSCVMLWEQQTDAAARRQALADLWLNTSDTPDGQVIRGVVLNYVDEVVQESANPYLPEELERINAAHDFAQPFVPMDPS